MLRPDDLRVVSERLRRFRFERLTDYYASQKWARVRKRLYKKVPYQCYVCGVRNGLQAHHKVYSRLCQERLRDLCWLCDEDHEAVHVISLRKDWNIAKATRYLKSIYGKPERYPEALAILRAA